jgi:integrase
LTEEDVRRMMLAAKDVRWKAIISILASTGVRPGEMRSLRLKDVIVKPGCIQLNITEGKMAGRMGSRTVFIAEEDRINALKTWLASHPQRGSLESWLFVEEVRVYRRNAAGKRLKDQYGRYVLEKHEWQPLSERSLLEGLKRIAADAGVNGRPVNPYLFRHGVATKLYKSMPTEMARRLMGHASDSSMPAVYTHLGTDDLEHAIMEACGKTDASKEELIAGMQTVMKCLEEGKVEELMAAWQRAKASLQ